MAAWSRGRSHVFELESLWLSSPRLLGDVTGGRGPQNQFRMGHRIPWGGADLTLLKAPSVEAAPSAQHPPASLLIPCGPHLAGDSDTGNRGGGVTPLFATQPGPGCSPHSLPAHTQENRADNSTAWIESQRPKGSLLDPQSHRSQGCGRDEAWENPRAELKSPQRCSGPSPLWYWAQRGAGTDLRSHSEAGQALDSQAPFFLLGLYHP